MTSSPIRGRPRHAKAQIPVRVAHAVLGAVAGAGWLMSPVMTVAAGDPVPAPGAVPVASAAAPEQDETSTTDLVLPLVAGGAAVVLAGYGYLRRTRRARTRTTPGRISAQPPVPSPADSERQARAALVLADDCVRTSREELSFVRERFGDEETEPYADALRAAETELAAAFAIWLRYEEGVAQEATARRQTLVGVVGRCAEAGRLLDAAAPGLDRLRSLESDLDGAVQTAEARFRALTAAPAARGEEGVTDRLVLATTHLNGARQATDPETAAAHLRVAEGAVAQADVLVTAAEELLSRLDRARRLIPPALTDAEARLAAIRAARTPVGLTARLAHADTVLAAVRTELTGGSYDPLDALRRITRAMGRLDAARSGVLDTAARLVAEASLAGAESFVAVHRGAVGVEARSRLADAAGSLAADAPEPADTRARESRELAERDVRSAESTATPTAVLAGLLTPTDPPAYGGPATRARHRFAPP
ncbi:hypothetical protein NX794_14165 [Streptomyces sp. LP11]|uniref:Fibrillarin n=1 Tax=Streptomyces pyxinicus TaxID=2970331 RepID=A0ABT2B1P1_9ACTN|nr:hypothetical protein [Streptomyces sp. LP11]MCS0602345.1 hypothetical protein [Streptomyces sp. LP11]